MRFRSVSIVVAALAATACMTTRKSGSSTFLASAPVKVRVGTGSVFGIYRLNYETGEVAQVVALAPTMGQTKYAYVRVGSETHYYLVGDGPDDDAKNLLRAVGPSDASVTVTPERVLGNGDLNGPAICGDGESVVVGQLLPNALQALRVPLPAATQSFVAFHRPDFLVGDLHCRAEIDGFFFAGFDCPPGGTLPKCFQSSDSLTSIYHFVNGDAVAVTRPEIDVDVTSLPRPPLFHRGDVDPASARLSDGRVVLSYSRLFNHPSIAGPDAPTSEHENGYQKLMLAMLPADAASPGGESNVDFPALFRRLWQVPEETTVDFIMSTSAVREMAATAGEVEFVVGANIKQRGVEGVDGNQFNGLLYGRVNVSEIGKPSANLSEMRELMTLREFSCGIWRGRGSLGESDGKVYVYGAAFPKFGERGTPTLYFSTVRGPIGDFVDQGGGAIRLQGGKVVPANEFLDAFCGPNV